MDDAELAGALREFLERFADAVTNEPARAANALGDDLGTRHDLSGGQARALVELLRDGTVARILAGQPLGALKSDTSVDEESRHWALGQWAGAVPSTLPPPSPAPLPNTDPPTAPLPDPLTPTAPDSDDARPEPDRAVVVRTEDRPRRRWPLVLAIGVVGAVLLGAVGAVVLRRDDIAEARTTDVGVISDDGVEFNPISISDGVTAQREWSVDGTALNGTTMLTNKTEGDLIVVYDELVPKDVAASVDDVTFDPEPDEVIEADPIVRYRVELAPGDTFEVFYNATLENEPTLDELVAWADSWQKAYDDHLADPEHSPADADADGVPDGQDDCDNQAAPDSANGCADADGDGFVDDGTDLCPDEAGTLDGCADADADGFPDANGDLCPTETGTLDGCLDTDVDGFPDSSGDICPGIPGTAAGCPDRDGDGVTDVLDACPDAGAPGSPSGCPDSDGDSFPDDTDRCPADPGPVGGCPDGDGDGVANVDDQCPSDKGSPPNGCPDRDGDGVLDSQDKCPDRSGSRSFAGCPAPVASVSGPTQLSGTNAGTYRANVTNGTFIAWDDGGTRNPEEYGFVDPCNGVSFTLYFTYRSLDGQVLRSPVLTVTHIRVC